MMELDPLDGDVICQRYEQLTGRKAEHRSSLPLDTVQEVTR